jgi:hypothetical protein
MQPHELRLLHYLGESGDEAFAFDLFNDHYAGRQMYRYYTWQSIAAQLTALRRRGWVSNDGDSPARWSLTDCARGLLNG